MNNTYDLIRSHYDFLTPKIIEASGIDMSRWVAPYCGVDWMSLFSPIEKQTWQAIRSFGQAPLYPQYPIGKYFVDFGNPVVKIAIECDGAEFHLDKAKDRLRDIDLRKQGWRVFRIPGSDCIRQVSDDYYEIGQYDDKNERLEILEVFYNKTIEGLIKSIGIYYFGYETYYEEPDEYQLALNTLKSRVSIKKAS